MTPNSSKEKQDLGHRPGAKEEEGHPGAEQAGQPGRDVKKETGPPLLGKGQGVGDGLAGFLVGDGAFGQALGAHQLEDGDAEGGGQRLHGVDVGETQPPLPPADGLVGDVELRGQGGLGEAAGFAHLGNECAEFLCIHTIASFWKKYNTPAGRLQPMGR